MSLASIEKATQQLQMIDWGAVTHGHDAPTGDAIFIADAHANAAEKAALEAAQSAAAAAQNEVEQLRRSLNAEKSRNHLLEARASAASAAVERLEKQQTPPPSITKNGDAHANGGGRPSVEEQVELVARELQQEADRQVRAATAGSAAAVAAAEREVREAREETSMVRLQLDEAESRRIAAEEARAASDAARAEAEAARNAAMARAAAAEQDAEGLQHAYEEMALAAEEAAEAARNAQAAQEALEGQLATKRANSFAPSASAAAGQHSLADTQAAVDVACAELRAHLEGEFEHRMIARLEEEKEKMVAAAAKEGALAAASELPRNWAATADAVGAARAASAEAKAEAAEKKVAAAADELAVTQKECDRLQSLLDQVRQAMVETTTAQEEELDEMREQITKQQALLQQQAMAPAAAAPFTPGYATPGIAMRGTPASAAATVTEEERAVQTEALERAALALEEEREQLQRTAQASARREARRAETQEIIAQELADLQAVVEGMDQPGPALIRISRERMDALEQLRPMQRRVDELEEDLEAYEKQIERLKARNAALLERERRRQGAI